jgi:hypothetical protein
MAGHPGEGSQDRAAKAQQLERDCQRNKARTGKPEGRPVEKRQSEQDSQDRAARAEQPGQDSHQDRTAIRTGQPSGQGTQNKIARTVLFPTCGIVASWPAQEYRSSMKNELNSNIYEMYICMSAVYEM